MAFVALVLGLGAPSNVSIDIMISNGSAPCNGKVALPLSQPNSRLAIGGLTSIDR